MNYIAPAITLKELSRLSGFSISTVSKALNNKLDISLKTKEVIKHIAKKHNYVPNNYAVALRKKRTQTLAVIIPQANTSFYGSFIYNIEKLANTHGYKIVLFQSFESSFREQECIKNSNDGSVDGVILLSKNVFNTKDYNNRLPIEYVHITKNLSSEQLKKHCIKSFSKLVSRID